MNTLGVYLTLMIGRSTPRLAPPELVEALESVEVTHADQGPSGFQMTFSIGRSSAVDIVDYRLLRGLESPQGPFLKPFNRVVLTVGFSVKPQILIDGIITNLQLSPSEEPGQSRLVVTGEDISLLMDLEERQETYPDMTHAGEVVLEILQRYREHLRIDVIANGPDQAEHVFRQIVSDRAYIKQLAWRLGYVFYITPGDRLSQKNKVYFGPKRRNGESQPALAFNMGPHSNVDSISFTYNGERPVIVSGEVQYPWKGEIIEAPIDPVDQHTLSPRMALQDARYSDLAHRKKVLLHHKGDTRDESQRFAQARVNRSSEDVVTATGELDSLRYGLLLEPHKKVGLRGVGRNFDGDYYIGSVTHSIQRGSYKQRFSLSREGVGALSTMVRP